jgi:hypothetical protein
MDRSYRWFNPTSCRMILASISTTTFYANVIVPHGFRIALILWLSRSVALVQRGTDTTVYLAPIPKHLS